MKDVKQKVWKNITLFFETHSTIVVKVVPVVYICLLAIITVGLGERIVDRVVYFRFVLTLTCFMVYFFFLTFKQLMEVFRPPSWLTGLRYLILGTLAMTTITLIPSIVFQYYLSMGQSYETLRKVSSVVGGLNLAGTTVLLVLIYTYRRKGD